jgi:hypothetical protein
MPGKHIKMYVPENLAMAIDPYEGRLVYMQVIQDHPFYWQFFPNEHER